MRRFRSLLLLLLALIGMSILVHYFPLGRWLDEYNGSAATEQAPEPR
jgi:hypothetical protein